MLILGIFSSRCVVNQTYTKVEDGTLLCRRDGRSPTSLFCVITFVSHREWCIDLDGHGTKI